ncbi:type VII secretion integral membrane protein EccD [Streptomyces gibsoniae]|uniref:Type VII secretion integral membrane protein EccD n=1 Tax=Streptomyces gibsoniae TaxID=3075529 RepID=A0ABU2U5W9_9ACTN|nr:type VII secretion integral membrane protein EccD [Streptomyces sp. DSM 41699]MDT0468596.1 type VII secretion integral membrane protein EccD [Streptomyces sp. DSM 41699]
MSTGTSTGFCRITIAAPDSRVDVALPEDLPIQDLFPEIVRLSGLVQPDTSPAGYHLVRREGQVLDASRSLQEQRVRDGEVLLLRTFADSLPPAVHDDVVDAIAAAVKQDLRSWNDNLMRVAGLVSGALLLVMLGFVFWFADPIRHDMHGLQGILAGVVALALTALAGVRARVYDDRASAVALGVSALPHALIAGSGVIPQDAGHGPGRIQFLVGCVVVLLFSIVLIMLLPQGDAPFVAAALAAAIGTLAVFCGVLTDAQPRQIAAGTAVVALAVVGFLPGWSARFAKLPIGFRNPEDLARARREGRDGDLEAVDVQRIVAQTSRGHELLLGLVGGCAAVIVGAGGAVLGFSDSGWAQLLALCTGLAAMLRARLFRYTAQVTCLFVAGVVTLGLLVLGLAISPPTDILVELAQGNAGPVDIRTLWLGASVAAGVLLLISIALIVPQKGLSPFWGRMLDLADSLVLLSLVPVCLAVLDVYGKVRGGV